jgi:hypothetical protein
MVVIGSAEAENASFADGSSLSALALGLDREVDEHDAVLLHDADQEDDADDGDDRRSGGRESVRAALQRLPMAASTVW